MAKKDPSQTNSPVILEKFDEVNFKAWNKLSKQLDEFNLKLFYHLEGLRAYHHEALCDALRDTKIIELRHSDWWRCVDFQYSNEFLSSKGSMIKGGRFNIGNDLGTMGFKPFPALYLAETKDVAECEKFGLEKVANGLSNQELALRKPTSFAAIRLEFELHNVYDLTKLTNLKKFSNIISEFHITSELKDLALEINKNLAELITSPKMLKDNLLSNGWRYYPVQHNIPSNSQLFGRMLKDAGFEAIMYPSTKFNKKNCMAIFTENLMHSASYIETMDKAPNSVKHKRLDSDNWLELSET